jgi:hypothetical protein
MERSQREGLLKGRQIKQRREGRTDRGRREGGREGVNKRTYFLCHGVQ